MFLVLPPTPELRALVHAYWFVEDLEGEHEGHPIRTSPIPLSVLSVNIGRPNAAEDGSLVPRASILGFQSCARSWRSWSQTYFVMAMLTVPGVVRLFPQSGSGCADRLLDLGAITGDALAGALSRDVAAAMEPRRIAARLDRWLILRLSTMEDPPESRRIAAACDILRRGGSVEMAAMTAEVDRRQLHRWFTRHLGIGPKAFADLKRLQSSLRGVQTGQGDPIAGFSDQAHQIRSWRRRLGVTPGAYRARDRSAISARFSTDAPMSSPAFYL